MAAPWSTTLAPEVLSQALAAVPNGLIVGLVPWGQPLFTEPMRVEEGRAGDAAGPGAGTDARRGRAEALRGRIAAP